MSAWLHEKRACGIPRIRYRICEQCLPKAQVKALAAWLLDGHLLDMYIGIPVSAEKGESMNPGVESFLVITWDELYIVTAIVTMVRLLEPQS